MNIFLPLLITVFSTCAQSMLVPRQELKTPCMGMKEIILLGDTAQFQTFLDKHKENIDENKQGIIKHYLEKKIEKYSSRYKEHRESVIAKGLIISAASAVFIAEDLSLPAKIVCVLFLGCMGIGQLDMSYQGMCHYSNRRHECDEMLKIIKNLPVNKQL